MMPMSAHATSAPPITRPAEPGDEALALLTADDPSTWPAVLAFSTMTSGAIESAHAAISELEERLSHVLRGHEPEAPMPEPNYPADASTALARRMKDQYEQAAGLERRIHSIRWRLGV